MADFEQYREALCFELAGRSFQLAMENGVCYALHFLDGNMLGWGALGQPMRGNAYQCLKLDDDAYLVSANLQERELGDCAALLLDVCARRVIVALAAFGGRADSRVFTGELLVAGYPKAGDPLMKCGDFTGKRILWRLGAGYAAVHAFVSDESACVSRTDPWGSATDAAFAGICDASVYPFREDVYALCVHGRAAGDPMGEQLMLVNTNTVRCIGLCIPTGQEAAAASGVLFSGCGAFLRPAETEGIPSEVACGEATK